MQSNNNDSLDFNEEKPPYKQFDECKDHPNCKYRDTSGNCIYETCIFDNESPGQNPTWFFECQICHKTEVREPRDMKVMFCDECLERIKKTEELPFTCVFCGESQSTPSKIPLSGICDKCFNKLNNAIHCKNCGNS